MREKKFCNTTDDRRHKQTSSEAKARLSIYIAVAFLLTSRSALYSTPYLAIVTKKRSAEHIYTLVTRIIFYERGAFNSIHRSKRLLFPIPRPLQEKKTEKGIKALKGKNSYKRTYFTVRENLRPRLPVFRILLVRGKECMYIFLHPSIHSSLQHLLLLLPPSPPPPLLPPQHKRTNERTARNRKSLLRIYPSLLPSLAIGKESV